VVVLSAEACAILRYLCSLRVKELYTGLHQKAEVHEEITEGNKVNKDNEEFAQGLVAHG
jgi:3-deoxy-D-manno-octulosonate 8-phosphate phosphatase KdsC-like HAD superfamily phosphatase